MAGKLNYLKVTRPNIAYSVSFLSHYMSSPTVSHWAAVGHILCYSKEAPEREILHKNHGHTRIECFSNADCVGSKEDKISTSGYCVFVGGNLISWKSNKQNVVLRSSAELQYGAMVQSVCKIMWIRWLLMEVGIEISALAKLWYDNQVVKHIAYNLVFHK